MNSLRYILSITFFLLSTWIYANKEIDSLLNVLDHDINIWGIERSGFFNGREKWAKGFENQRV